MRKAFFVVGAVLFFAAAASASAHVGYVVPANEIAANAGADFAYFLSPLKDGGNVALMLGALAVFAGLYFFLSRASWMRALEARIEEGVRDYPALYPWMLRLSAGIALIGAGTSGVLISPVVPGSAWLGFAQTLIGFLLMAGFLLGPAVFAGIVLYLYALGGSGYLFGNFDFLATLAGLVLLADPRPGVDHLLKIPFVPSLGALRRFAPVVVRVGVGVAMVFLALYEKALNPHVSALVVGEYGLQSVIPVSPAMWVFGAGAIELLVGLLLVFGIKPRLTSAVAFVVLSFSFFYFQEAVYSHITLFAALSVVFASGGRPLDEDRLAPRVSL